MLENLYGPVDAVDGDFAGEDLLLAAVGADDEPAVGVHIDGCAAACAAARQSKVTWRPRLTQAALYSSRKGAKPSRAKV